MGSFSKLCLFSQLGYASSDGTAGHTRSGLEPDFSRIGAVRNSSTPLSSESKPLGAAGKQIPAGDPPGSHSVQQLEGTLESGDLFPYLNFKR